MRALDTNVLIRFLLDDDRAQARKVRRLFEQAEREGDRFLVPTTVLLELIWVLGAVYDLGRDEVLEVVELLTQMPILEFEDYDTLRDVIRVGGSTRAHLSDILIGLSAKSSGCTTTLTFEKGLSRTGLFQQL
jgi:predicted nucleic-acid-binding protein